FVVLSAIFPPLTVVVRQVKLSAIQLGAVSSIWVEQLLEFTSLVAQFVSDTWIKTIDKATRSHFPDFIRSPNIPIFRSSNRLSNRQILPPIWLTSPTASPNQRGT